MLADTNIFKGLSCEPDSTAIALCRRYWSPEIYPMRGARVAVPEMIANDCLTIDGSSFNVDGFDETYVNLIIVDGTSLRQHAFPSGKLCCVS